MTAILDAAGALDTAKLPLAAPVGWMQRWLHDLLGLRLAGLIRYYPDERAALAALAPRLNVARLPAFEQSLLHASRFGHHTLNVRMQLEQLLLAYQGLFAAA
jgi:DNA polymerase-3 subunit delta'